MLIQNHHVGNPVGNCPKSGKCCRIRSPIQAFRIALLDEADDVWPSNAIRRDGSINPVYFDVVDGCHIWNGSVENGRPFAPKDGQRIYLRWWVMRAERGRHISETCGNPLCINPEHLVVEPTVHETIAERLARLPEGALNAYDRDLLERRARGQLIREIAADIGVTVGSTAQRLTIADRRLFQVLAELDRKTADPDLTALPQEIDKTPGERELG